jgi:hypothetical protein
MIPFLDCKIWSITCDGIDQYFFVEKIYHYNSLKTGIINIIPGHIQIPEYEIYNLDLLSNTSFDIINEYRIPIIKLNDNRWTIDLKYYEQYHSNLQSSSN